MPVMAEGFVIRSNGSDDLSDRRVWLRFMIGADWAVKRLRTCWHGRARSQIYGFGRQRST